MRTEKANEKVKKGKDVFYYEICSYFKRKKYEIEIERVEEYKPLDRGVTVNAPAPILQRQQLRLRLLQPRLPLRHLHQPRSGTCTGSSSGSRSSRRTVRRCSHAW